MSYQDCYRACLDKIPALAAKCKPIRGYTSDVDALIQWDVATFNALLAQHNVTEEDLSCFRAENVETLKDFLRLVASFAIEGRGGETEITSRQAVDDILANFKIELALGGTCAQGSAALGALGASVLAHITDRSREVAKFLDYGVVDVIRDGQRVPIIEQHDSMWPEPLFHFVVQYAKGDVLKIGDREVELVSSNRVILDYDSLNPIVPIDENFLRYVEAHAAEFSSYCISGFNAIIDSNILKERITALKNHYCAVRENNPHLLLYLESAHYLSIMSRDYVYMELAPWIDILGMNEEELSDFARRWAPDFDFELADYLEEHGGLEAYDGIEHILRAMSLYLHVCKIPALVVHSKDYSIFCGTIPIGMTENDITDGLTLGNLLAGTRARVGHYGSLEDCAGTLDVPLSSRGLKLADELDAIKRDSGDRDGLARTAILVPARSLDNPLCTVGLGDCFTAGLQLVLHAND